MKYPWIRYWSNMHFAFILKNLKTQGPLTWVLGIQVVIGKAVYLLSDLLIELLGDNV